MSAPETSQTRDYFWNTAASAMMSLATVILTVVVTRSAGLAAGGVFGLAYQAGQQFQPLGVYEVRPYQVTDLEHRFSFGTYLATRIVTVGLMILGIVGYAVLFGDGLGDMLLIILIASLIAFFSILFGTKGILGRALKRRKING